MCYLIPNIRSLSQKCILVRWNFYSSKIKIWINITFISARQSIKNQLVWIYRHLITVWSMRIRFPYSSVIRHIFGLNVSEVWIFCSYFGHFCVWSEIWACLFGFATSLNYRHPEFRHLLHVLWIEIRYFLNWRKDLCANVICKK